MRSPSARGQDSEAFYKYKFLLNIEPQNPCPRANEDQTKGYLNKRWRPELNRRKRICSPLPDHSATPPADKITTPHICLLP